jgi:phage gp29-like protein
MARPSFFQRLLGVFKPTPIAQTVLRSTPDSENPYPRGSGGRKVALGQGQGAGPRQLPVYTWTDWDTVDKVKAALTNLEAGHFLQAAQLVDAMGRDDRISGVLRIRVNSLFGLPVDYDEDGAENITKELKDLRPKMFPKSQAKKLLRSGIMLGVGLARNVWERTETSWTPRLEWWHPQFIQWRWDTWSFHVQTTQGLVEVKRGDPDWVLYTPSGEHLGWLEGTVRALAIPWLIRQWARRDWARYSEVHGLPIRKGIVPASAAEPDVERFIYELSQLGSEVTIRLPQGSGDGTKFDVELLEATSQGSWEGFQALLQKTDADIAIAVLGQNLTTEISKGDGSRAAAQVHQSIRQDVLEDDGSSLDDCLHEQVVQPWALYNYGDADAAPAARTHTEPPDDLKGTAETFKSVADALNGFKALRVPVNVEQVCSTFGVPVEEDGEFPDLTEEPDPAMDPNAQDPNAPPAKKPGDPAPERGE